MLRKQYSERKSHITGPGYRYPAGRTYLLFFLCFFLFQDLFIFKSQRISKSTDLFKRRRMRSVLDLGQSGSVDSAELTQFVLGKSLFFSSVFYGLYKQFI